MNDLEFDALLDGVLREHGRVEPLSGLEERVLARVQGKKIPRGWTTWAAVAASAISVGVMVWISARLTSDMPRMHVPNLMSQSAHVGAALVIDEGATPKSQETGLHSRAQPRMRSNGAKSGASLRRGYPIQTAPLDIEPLMIKPLEVGTQRWKVEQRKVKPNEETSWNVVFVCDSRCIDHRNSAVGEATF